MHTPDFTQQNITKLAELFPNCVTEARDDETGELKKAIDFDQLRQELSDHVVDGPRERYHLNWPGKKEALLAANAPIAKTLRPCREESVDFDTTKNLFIEGDNLDALKLLQETYLNKVKMIYIDPPYNTGNDFVYDDDFSEDSESYLQRSEQHDAEGGRLVANTENNGRFHSDWLDMIHPRLRLIHRLLREDGVVLISIDDNEVTSLRKVCDEIFGESNFIAQFVWAGGRKNDSKLVSVSHEYIVAYARSKSFLKEKKIVWRIRKAGLEKIYKAYRKLKSKHGDDYDAMTAGLKAWYKDLPDSEPAKRHKHYSHVDERGIYFPDNISWPGGGGPKYEVLHPMSGKPCAVPSRGWMFGQPERMQEVIADNRVHFGEDETAVPCIKSHLKDREEEVPYSVFYQDGRASTKRLRELLGEDIFDHPKDELILQELIEACTSDGDVLMDFFAGSGTFAHAAFQANAKQGVHRPFVVSQLPETLDPANASNAKAKKRILRAIKFLDQRGKAHTVAEIAKERVRITGKKIKEEAGLNGENLDIGFRVLKVDSSNMKDVYYTPEQVDQHTLAGQVDNIKEDRSDEDLLFQVLLDWGVDLALPITPGTIQGKTVYYVDENALAACFEPGIDEDFIKELAQRKPLRAVFRDSGYGSDAAKINVEQILKLISPTTEVKSI